MGRTTKYIVVIIYLDDDGAALSPNKLSDSIEKVTTEFKINKIFY